MARNYYSEEEILDGVADPASAVNPSSYTAVAFNSDMTPIQPQPGGSFDWNRYNEFQSQPAPPQEVFSEFTPQIGDQSVNHLGVESTFLGPGQAQGETSYDREQELLQQHYANGVVDARARQFQGMNLYRQLRAGGASHEEALMRAGPNLYASGSQYVNAMAKNNPVQTRTVPIYDPVTGKEAGFQVITGGQAKTVLKQAEGHLSNVEQKRLDMARDEVKAADGTIRALNADRDKDLNKNYDSQMEAAIKRREAAKSIAQDLLSTGDSGPTGQKSGGGEVEKILKNGKRAMFDSQTQKFLYYAK